MIRYTNDQINQYVGRKIISRYVVVVGRFKGFAEAERRRFANEIDRRE